MKIILALLSFLLIVGLGLACADAPVGKWKLNELRAPGQTANAEQLRAAGMTQVMQFNQDGTLVIEQGKETARGTWQYVKDGEKLVVKQQATVSVTVNGVTSEQVSEATMTYTIAESTPASVVLTLGQGPGSMVFKYLRVE